MSGMFLKSVYPLDIIKMAVNDFSDMCGIRIEEIGKYWKVDFETSSDSELIKKEFGNYLIDLLNGATRSG